MNIHQWIINNLNNKSVVIEAGSSDGYDTEFFSRILPEGRIFAFEPIPELYSETLNKVNNRNNVEVYNMALSTETGKSKIYISENNGNSWGSSSLLKPKDHLKFHPNIKFKESIFEIDCITLDDFVENKKILHIDLLWLDMQGLEPVVLINSLNSLKISKYLYTEVSLIKTYEGVILYDEYRDFLEKNGFEIVFEDLQWEDMGNVLFKNKYI